MISSQSKYPVDACVGVCSRSFSKNDALRSKLLRIYRNVRFYDEGLSLGERGLVDFLQPCEKIIVSLEKIDERILDGLPKLKVISKYGVGLDMLDLAALRQRGIRLGWTAGTNCRAVSELVLAEMLNLLRNLPQLHLSTHQGSWRRVIGDQLSSKTVGILGCGHVGQDLVKLLTPFQCKIISHDKKPLTEFYTTFGVKSVSLDQLLVTADIVTIHLPLTDETQNLIGYRELSSMKPHAILLNAARGGIVDEQALKTILADGAIRGAAMDVFAKEPPDDHGLLSLDNFICTPHIGGSTHDAILAMGTAAIVGLDQNQVPTNAFIAEHS